jgi:hypothetical protein
VQGASLVIHKSGCDSAGDFFSRRAFSLRRLADEFLTKAVDSYGNWVICPIRQEQKRKQQRKKTKQKYMKAMRPGG